MKDLLKLSRILQELQCADHIGIREWAKEVFFAFRVSDRVEKSESVLGALREWRLSHLSKDLKRFKKEGLVEFVFDDEAFIISVPFGELDAQRIADKFHIQI